MLTYLAIAKRYRPKWLVWENVPGVLSSNKGRDFGTFLGGLAECGYGFAYRILDAQYFGLAQRRKRVFVVGHLGDWRPAAAVFFEPESLSGHTAPSRKAGQKIAPTVSAGAPFSRTGNERVEAEAMVVAHCLRGRANASHRADSDTYIAHTLRANHDASEDGTGRGTPLVAHCLNAGGMGRQDYETETFLAHPIAFKVRGGCEGGGKGFLGSEETDFTLSATQDQWVGVDTYNGALTGEVGATLSARSGIPDATGPRVSNGMAVRRLTPIECERLQGFPDNYTNIPGAKDGPRYKALGNSMAVPCMRWIGERIQMVSDLMGGQ